MRQASQETELTKKATIASTKQISQVGKQTHKAIQPPSIQAEKERKPRRPPRQEGKEASHTRRPQQFHSASNHFIIMLTTPKKELLQCKPNDSTHVQSTTRTT
eukprot:2120954-Amphidinium_carterae.2